jgi:hypothetical protein
VSASIPKSAFSRAAATAVRSFASSSSRSQKRSWIRRVAPHYSYNSYWGFDGRLQSSMMHVHPFEIQPAQGGRFGWFFDRNQDNPLTPFVVYNRDGNRVVIPAGEYTW